MTHEPSMGAPAGRWLGQLVSWEGAFLVPLCALLICALGARLVAPNAD